MPDPSAPNPRRPSLVAITDVFARYGNFTLGGGSATVAVIHREIVGRRAWVTPDDFGLCFALARLTPGTNVLAFCTGIGWLLRGLPGAVTALLAASIPCTAIVVLATAAFRHWQDDWTARAVLHGAVAAAVAITAKTAWTIAHPLYRPGSRVRVATVAGAAFLLYVVLRLPAIEILLLAAALGAALPPARAA